jgi:two-component system sensor histidine kinase QseC
VTFLAALNGYRSSMAEAEKLMDSQLENAAMLMSADVWKNAKAQIIQDKGKEFAFQIWREQELVFSSSVAPEHKINEFVPGFRYANFSGYRWRTLTRTGDSGHWYIVAERADLRHKLAENVVLESIVPLLLWLPVSALLTWLFVGWGLRPLRDLSAQINLRRSDDLDPLHYEDPPAELVQLTESTNSLLSRLSAAFEREKHFAAHAAHELRTPLSVLKVHLYNLKNELPAGHEGLQHANAGLERMHHLVEQILDLNRTNPELIKANFSSLDLHSLAQRVTAAAWPKFSTADQSLSLTGEAVMMYGDETLLEILLQNLLDNANKYTPNGGTILVSVTGDSHRARLVVEDSGSGVPAQERDLVFQRFHRVVNPSTKRTTGSGLGLAIVQHIVQLHGASITLSNSQFSSGLAVVVDFESGGSGAVNL